MAKPGQRQCAEAPLGTWCERAWCGAPCYRPAITDAAARLPWDFHPALQPERLRLCARLLVSARRDALALAREELGDVILFDVAEGVPEADMRPRVRGGSGGRKPAGFA